MSDLGIQTVLENLFGYSCGMTKSKYTRDLVRCTFSRIGISDNTFQDIVDSNIRWCTDQHALMTNDRLKNQLGDRRGLPCAGLYTYIGYWIQTR